MITHATNKQQPRSDLLYLLSAAACDLPTPQVVGCRQDDSVGAGQSQHVQQPTERGIVRHTFAAREDPA